MSHTVTGTTADFLALAFLIAGHGAVVTILLQIVFRSAIHSIRHARAQRRAMLAQITE